MYDVQASAAVPSIFIPSPTGFFVLKMSKPIAQASRIAHSLVDGFAESHGVSGGFIVVISGVGDVVGKVDVVIGRVGGCLMVLSMYPKTPLAVAAVRMSLRHDGQFVPSNLSVSENMNVAEVIFWFEVCYEL